MHGYCTGTVTGAHFSGRDCGTGIPPEVQRGDDVVMRYSPGQAKPPGSCDGDICVRVPVPEQSDTARMCADRKIDIARLLADVPDLAQLTGVCCAGWFAGATFTVTWDGQWEAVGRDGFARLDDMPRDEIVIDTARGALSLRRPLATNSSFDGRIRGRAISSSLRIAGTENLPPAQFRTYVSVSDLQNKVVFPEGYEDPKLQFHATARLSLVLTERVVDLLYIAQGDYLVLEAPAVAGASDDAERFRIISGATRMVLSYLIGVRLDRRSCEVQLDENGRILQVDWFPGRTGDGDSIYRPIPVSWTEWCHASQALKLPLRDGPLVPKVVSRMVQTLIDEPGLAAPIEYLLRFHDAPVEMRGAVLSVALESLTDQLKKKGLFKFPKPLADDTWKPFLEKVKGVVEAQGDWTKEQRKVVHSRLLNLNSPTNAAKLTASFEALGVELTDDECKAIEKRNRLLHQGRLLDPIAVRGNREEWKEAYAIEMRIFTAVNKLLLVHLGYEGAVIDWGATPVGTPPDVYVLVAAPARRCRT